MYAEQTIEKLGQYFTHFEVYEKYGITFERFVYLVVNKLWDEIA